MKITDKKVQDIWYTVHITFKELANYYWDEEDLESFGRLMAGIYTNDFSVAEDELLEYINVNKNLFEDNLSCITQMEISLLDNEENHIEVEIHREL